MRVAIFIIFLTCAYAHNSPLKIEYEWKHFDYVWKSEDQKNYYVKQGLYDIRKTLPIGVDRAQDGRTFLTMVRRRSLSNESMTLPASVHVVSNKTKSGPLLIPYPNWSWHETDNCTGIVNAYKVAIDECNRIWILDSGRLLNRNCEAKLLVFDLSTDRLIQKIVIPDEIAKNKNGTGLLINLIVQTHGSKCDTTVYIPDTIGYGLIVYDGKTFKRFEGDVYNPENKYKTITVNGENVDFLDGIKGIAVSPPNFYTGARFLTFSPLASRSIFTVNTRDLKSYSSPKDNIKYYRGIDVISSQSNSQAISNRGVLFYSPTNETAIGCWNINNPLKKEFFKIAMQDSDLLQFINSMKILPPRVTGGGERLLMLSNQFQKYSRTSNRTEDIVIRVISVSVNSLLKDNTCYHPSI